LESRGSRSRRCTAWNNKIWARSTAYFFLFKWQKEEDKRSFLSEHETGDIYFAKQIIHNACATQALINVLLNVDFTHSVDNGDVEIKLGSELANLKEFTRFMDFETRGSVIGQSEPLRLVHNSFARAEPFLFEDDEKKNKKNRKTEDAFHFIGYVKNEKGQVFELDGLKPGPVLLGSCSAGTHNEWVGIAKSAIQIRIEKYAAKEIRFNLMALTSNRSTFLRKKIENLQKATPISSEIEELKHELENENTKRQLWREENAKRKHNYVPFLFSLLTILAQKDQLQPLLEKARSRKEEKLSESKKQKSSP